jgi:uncharacterized protein YyaL (SSP411 family)
MNQLPLIPLLSTSLYHLTGQGKAPTPATTLRPHAEAALAWIDRAVTAANDGGVSKGFDLIRGRWAPSYPETTGYTIPTLLNASQVYNAPQWYKLAYSLAEYELSHATAEGGVVHWRSGANVPIVFDTGQVMFGWIAAYRASQENGYLLAALRAGSWLSAIQGQTGSWKTHQHLNTIKTIDTRVAWAMLELHQITHEPSLHEAAVRNLEWAVQQQDPSGWFDRCSFVVGKPPYIHTLAYTAEGLFECGTLLGEEKFIQTAQKTADALLERQRPDGGLPGTFGPTWSDPANWSCLTGNAQMARLWLRFYQLTKSEKYLQAARKAIGFVAGVQNIRTSNANLRGAIPGSQPLWGEYERFKTPNWAAKFFLDAIMQLEEVESGKKVVIYAG